MVLISLPKSSPLATHFRLMQLVGIMNVFQSLQSCESRLDVVEALELLDKFQMDGSCFHPFSSFHLLISAIKVGGSCINLICMLLYEFNQFSNVVNCLQKCFSTPCQ